MSGDLEKFEEWPSEMRTVHDPYEGRDVQISDRLVDRLRGQYSCGPHLPNGRPEFGWRQFQAPPIQHEAAKRIEELEALCKDAYGMISSGPATEVARELFLKRMRTVLNWKIT